MNSVIASILGLLALSSHTLGIVCPPDYCKTITCQPVNPGNCVGRVEQHASFCGCCPMCIKILKLREKCLGMHIYGFPSGSGCAPGLVCDSQTNTCQAIKE